MIEKKLLKEWIQSYEKINFSCPYCESSILKIDKIISEETETSKKKTQEPEWEYYNRGQDEYKNNGHYTNKYEPWEEHGYFSFQFRCQNTRCKEFILMTGYFEQRIPEDAKEPFDIDDLRRHYKIEYTAPCINIIHIPKKNS